MSIPTFKYPEARIDLPNCPPPDYKETETTAFRWVHKDSGHPNNFLPMKFIKPDMVLRTPEVWCKSLGLSFFDTVIGAIEAWERRTERTPKFKEQVGDHIAEICIRKEDGVASQPEEKNFGHFTFHEYICCDFSQNIKRLELIK